MPGERERLHNLFPDLDFDPEALRAKYRAERDKRIREDGEDQYIEASSEFARYADDDPYAGPDDRERVDLEIDVAIIGAGFSGLMAAARGSVEALCDSGDRRFVIMMHGTWFQLAGIVC